MDTLRWIEYYINPQMYIDLEISGHKIGIYFLVLIAFSEAGFFTGLLFSSDSFLFVAGIYSSRLINQLLVIHNENIAVLVLASLIAAASILGNILAYTYGSKAEIYFNNRQNGLLYKRKYLEKAKLFFQKYGVWTIIFAHFLPLVRVFIPILSFVSGIRFIRFVSLVSISSAIWSFSIILTGHYLYRYLLTTYAFNLKQQMWIFISAAVIAIVVFYIFRSINRKFPSH